MPDVIHGPARVQVSSEGVPQFVQCLCGAAGHLPEGIWRVKRREEAPAQIELEPSIDFKGHFHTNNPSGLIPVADIDWGWKNEGDGHQAG